ncbi:MAG: phosphocholine cytidylyltransferase family protein [Candidatus Asgardarchaeia archaeon]
MEGKKLNAIILAAGRNVRLRGVAEFPKTLLKLGNCTLLDRIVLSFKGYVKKAVIVTGYKSDLIDKHIDENPDLFGDLEIKIIYNPHYIDMNNIYSFWMARKQMNEPFLLFNSDVLFHSKMIEILIGSKLNTALMIDDRKKLGKEEMKVLLNEDKLILDISKELDPSTADGEYIGIGKFCDREVTERIISECKRLIDDGRTDVFYEEAFRNVSKEKPCIYGISTEGLPWIEIDTPYDYEKAKNEIVIKI